jgi:succinate-semialdehyde dehydrogenase/glutarate-semialdehyde dehydrogenase
MAYESINPASGSVLARFSEHSDSEVQASIGAAHNAYREWRNKSFSERATVLHKVAHLMRERIDNLSRMNTLEMGKPIGGSRGETLLSADIFTYYADNAERFLAPVPVEGASGEATVVSQPLGVIFGVQPWNLPYYQLARFAAPNLMAGNTVLVKHAPSVPQCADLFAQLFRDAGAGEGIYTNLRLTNDQASVVIADDRVRGIAVTGSDRAGAAVAAQAGKVLKRTTLELGGSDPFIVLEDANLDNAIEAAVFSRLLVNGQGCACAKRFIIVESVFDRFLKGITKRLASIVIGDPMEEATMLGPMSSGKARDLLLDQIEHAVKAGASLLRGGTKIEREGFFFEPAILTNVDRSNPAYTQEFFGPVFMLFKVRDESEAIQLANDTPFGLGSTVFTEDRSRAKRIALEIEAGIVNINHPVWTAPQLPFGGVKNSGYGRELSAAGIQEFTNKKLIHFAHAEANAK